MRRVAVFCIVLSAILIITSLCQPAVDPDNFAGEWYSSADQSIYLLQDGLIYCTKHSIALSENVSISGAYSYCKDSIFLFAVGIDGLETEKELYLIRSGDGSFLCENKDGSGAIYLIRDNK